MTWTYGNNPTSSNRDAVRLHIQDVNVSDQLFSDEEIAYFLSTEGDNVRLAASQAAYALSFKFNRLADRNIGDLKVAYLHRAENYLKMAQALKNEASARFASPYCGGISIADKDAVISDTDRVNPSFRKGMHDADGETDVDSGNE